MSTLSEDLVQELKAKHGDKLHVIDLDEAGEVVFKRPSNAVWSRFVDSLSDDDASKAKSIKDLVETCVVYPALADFRAIVEEFPGIVQTIAGEIKTVAGLSTKKKASKL